MDCSGDGLWEIARPLIPEDPPLPQGGGTQNTPAETLFAAIIYVLVSGCAWRGRDAVLRDTKSTALLPCWHVTFGSFWLWRLRCPRPGVPSWCAPGGVTGSTARIVLACAEGVRTA